MPGINGVGIAIALAGGVLAYSGLTHKSITNVAKQLLAGGNPANAPSQPSIVGGGTIGAASDSGTSGPLNTNGTGGMPSGTAALNQAIGRVQAATYGWGGGQQWAALVQLWDRESGWNNTADTRQTGAGGDGPGSPVFAYGIAQSRPATKYPKAGQPPDLGGSASASVQIAWGLKYIHDTYGSPANAWAHEQALRWY